VLAHSAPMSQRVALVTGGGSGLGRAISSRLAAEGAHVVIADIDKEGAATTLDIVQESGGRGEAVLLDVTDASAVNQAVAEAAETHGAALDCLVNNAGLDRGSDILEVDDDQWRRVFAVNVDGPMNLTRAFLRHVCNSPRRPTPADVVNIVSISALTVGTGASAYNSSKAALLKFTEVLQAEARERQLPVRACALSPSAMNTPMMGQWHLPEERMMDPGAIASLVSTIVTLPPDMTVQSLIVTGRNEYYPR
jgi:NAD(P)-dependent dehydrogenase (short-subunit alcohol dehydrogenase family)